MPRKAAAASIENDSALANWEIPLVDDRDNENDKFESLADKVIKYTSSGRSDDGRGRNRREGGYGRGNDRGSYGRGGKFDERDRRDGEYRRRSSYSENRDRRGDYDNSYRSDRRDDYGSRGRDDHGSRGRDDYGSRGRDDHGSRGRDDYGGRGRDDYGRNSYRDGDLPPSDTLVIFGLSDSLTMENFEDFLYNSLNSTGFFYRPNMPFDNISRRPKGFGFVNFDSVDDAIVCKKVLDEIGAIDGKPYKIDFSKRSSRRR